MNIFKLSLVTVSLLLVGCGGSSDSKSDNPSNNDSEVTTIADAQKSFKALSAFGGMGSAISRSVNTNTSSASKQFKNSQKTGTQACPNGGTLSFFTSDDNKVIEINYDNCKTDNSSLDGDIKITQFTEDSFKIEITKYTYSSPTGSEYMNITMEEKTVNNISTMSMNGEINEKSSDGEITNLSVTNMKFVEKDTRNDSWYTMDGRMNIESKCFTGSYTFQTIQKLVEATDGSENVESGILKLNSATYTFNNPDVTINVGSKSETILQSELEKRFETEVVCDE